MSYFKKFKDFLIEKEEKCPFCGNVYDSCTCPDDNHNNVRFKSYDITEKGKKGPITKHIYKSKNDKKDEKK